MDKVWIKNTSLSFLNILFKQRYIYSFDDFNLIKRLKQPTLNKILTIYKAEYQTHVIKKGKYVLGKSKFKDKLTFQGFLL